MARFLLEQEIFVHDEKRLHAERFFGVAKDVVELVAGLVEVYELAFAAEKCRGGAEVAAHGTPDRRNDSCRRAAFAIGHPQAHDASFEPGNDLRMFDWGIHVFAEIAAHPRNSLAAHDVVGVNHAFEARCCRHVAADNDFRIRRKLAHHAAHFAHLAEVYDDRGNPDNVILVGFEFAGKVFTRREIEHRAGRRNILLDHHDSPRPVKHTQRESALRPRHLVVVKLHGIDGPRTKLIVLRVRTENRTQQYARTAALGMNFHLRHTPYDCDDESLAGWQGENQ